MFEQAKQNQSNPMGLIQQITSNFTPQQSEQFFQQARQMGFSEEILNQVQNGINTK
jgi:hypothetical protein